jgi:hypothetical protein
MRRLLKILKTTFGWLAETALENVEVLQTKVKFLTALLQDSKVLRERERAREISIGEHRSLCSIITLQVVLLIDGVGK